MQSLQAKKYDSELVSSMEKPNSTENFSSLSLCLRLQLL